MCYTVFISTDGSQDLSALPREEFRFEKPIAEEILNVGEFLKYPNRWFLSSKYGGCSCHYRHLMEGNASMGFGEPEEWFPEDEEDVASTGAVYDALAALVGEGHRVDLVDLWNGDAPAILQEVVVDLSVVRRDAFRFWEGARSVNDVVLAWHPSKESPMGSPSKRISLLDLVIFLGCVGCELTIIPWDGLSRRTMLLTRPRRTAISRPSSGFWMRALRPTLSAWILKTEGGVPCSGHSAWVTSTSRRCSSREVRT